MKKLGFTLAEVLLALGIVGIISVLTVPTLFTSSQNKSNAAALAAAVSNFETAMGTMIQAEDANDIFQTPAFANLGGALDSTSSAANINRFKGTLSEYIELTDYSTNISGDYYDTIKNINRENININVFRLNTDYVAFKGSSNITYFINVPRRNIANRSTDDVIINAGVTLREVAANVIIDVNGESAPNMIGRDIYFFVLGSDGILYPYGGSDVGFKVANNVNSTWNGNGRYRCTDAVKNDNGVGCTARLIENGYKIDY